MKTVWKYPLRLTKAAQVIEMPAGASVLTVQIQPGPDPDRVALMCWALVDPMATYGPRIFYVVATGEPLPAGAKSYVATVQGEGYAAHVFEGEQA